MIGKSIVIKGEICASESFYVYGSVEGSIDAPEHRVTVGSEGRVKAEISAREVVIMGVIDGNVTADRVEIRREGSLTGNLVADRVSIEEGAYLSGAITVRKANEKDKVEIDRPELASDRWASFAGAERG